MYILRYTNDCIPPTSYYKQVLAYNWIGILQSYSKPIRLDLRNKYRRYSAIPWQKGEFSDEYRGKSTVFRIVVACWVGQHATTILNTVDTAPNFTRRGRFYHRNFFSSILRRYSRTITCRGTVPTLINLSTQIPESRLQLFSNQY